MAAVHSRFRRIVFLYPRTAFGGLTKYKIHVLNNLNHHYQVYQFDIGAYHKIQSK